MTRRVWLEEGFQANCLDGIWLVCDQVVEIKALHVQKPVVIVCDEWMKLWANSGSNSSISLTSCGHGIYPYEFIKTKFSVCPHKHTNSE